MPSADANGSSPTNSAHPENPRPASEPPRSAGDSGSSRVGRWPATQPAHPRPEPAGLPPEFGTPPRPADVGTSEVLTFQVASGMVQCPRFVGDYEVLRLRGGGGMGNVFVARNLFLDQHQALKTIQKRQLDSPEARQRFIDEMRAQSRLNHRNIARVHYAGMYMPRNQFAGMLYFVMSLEKEDLGEVIERTGPFPAADAANLVRRVAKGIAHAHARKVIHCDLKPRNILLGSDGAPKVTDFGLVKFLTDVQGPQVGSSSPFGTPSYMPPEQAEGRHDKVTERSDVYGLGAILYELLTGQPPYTGPSKDDILAQVRDPKRLPTPPRELNPKVPARLEAICMRCLKKYPYQRYATAREVAHELRLYLRPPLWKRRWKAAAGVLVCGGLIWAGWDRLPRPRAEAAAAEARVEEAFRQDNLEEARKQCQEAERVYKGLLDGRLVLDRDELKGKLDRAVARLGEIDKRDREKQRAAAFSAGEGEQALAAAARRAGRVDEEVGRLKAAADKYEPWRAPGSAYATDPDLLLRVGGVWTRLADLYEDRRDRGATEAALARAEDALGKPKPGERPPDDPRLTLARAEVSHIRGLHHFNDGQFGEAANHFTQGRDLRLQLWDRKQADNDYCRDLARSHGYLGDAQLRLGQKDLAHESYHRARVLRADLARKLDKDIEAQCLHARDFDNMAVYREWVAQPERAVGEYRERLTFYKTRVEPLESASHLLPAAHLTERAETRVKLAELLLDRPDRLTGDVQGEVGKLLEDALAEFAKIRGSQEEEKCSPQVRSPLARAYLARGRYEYRLDPDADPKGARQALERAKYLFTTLEDENKLQSDDHYHLAVTHALLAAVEPIEVERLGYQVLALDDLDKAVRVGYRRLERLRRDRALALLARAHPDKFKAIVERLEGESKKAAAGPRGEGAR